MFKIGDEVTYSNGTNIYTILDMQANYITRVKSHLNGGIYTDMWLIDHFHLVKPPLTKQELIINKIHFLGKKAEELKLATLSKQVDVPSAVATGGTGQEITLQRTVTRTPSALLADLEQQQMHLAELDRYIRYNPSLATGSNTTRIWMDEVSAG